MGNQNIAVKAHDITKRFASGDFYVDALKGVDLEAYEGEILMVVGPSGCGKTTLLSIIAGTLQSDTGSVNIYGTELKELNDEQMTEFRKKKIGFVFQQYHLINTLNTVENISIPLLLNGIPLKEAFARAKEMLSVVGLKGKEKLMPSRLSGGEQQRVAIARGLIHDPALLICDEPTAALDAENGLRIMNLIQEVAKSTKRCVIIVTHDPRIYEYADCLMKMEDGINIGTERTSS